MYSNNLICNILNYVSKNITEKITIHDLENRFYYNRYYIMKLFKKEIGLTVIEYINSIRIYNSILQIKNENKSLLNIALNNGFYSLEYFSETFKQITKLNPQKFKNYFHNKNNLSLKEIQLINSTFINLYDISTIKDTYLSRQKPIKLPIKKLSLFNR